MGVVIQRTHIVIGPRFPPSWSHSVNEGDLKMEPKPLTDEEAESCLAKPDESTQDFLFQQTMYRIKDPKASLKFYSEVLGMR